MDLGIGKARVEYEGFAEGGISSINSDDKASASQEKSELEVQALLASHRSASLVSI